MSNLPSGIVTFLFTDIEGSTKLAQQYPEDLPALLARHNAILRDAIETNHGQVFRIVGDAFCAAFQTPGDALNAALTAQRALQHEPWSPAPILVRMGINTGEARTGLNEAGSDPYIGYLTLTRVQRVMSSAHGGQVLLSNSSATLVRGELPKDVALRGMGEHSLKGLLHPEPLWQLVAPDLRQEFAPLQTLDSVPSNLPNTLNRLVGRARELREVKERLTVTRLLTLLGPGGTGKTRLSLQVGTDLQDNFEGRVYFVDLAATRDSEAVLTAIGRTVGLREKSDKSLLDELKGHIQQKKMLTLLDNFEQVTVAGPTMVDLLGDCLELKMLVTSREALHVRGENVFPVPPLALPPVEGKNVSPEQLAQSEAVQLFLERAQAVKPGFQLTKENAEAVALICVRLDGLPLAIELATARLNVFTPQALAERLENRLKLLRGGAHDLPARQQTLRDTIDWSYELLNAGEQDLFKFLAVFSGATFESIEAVAHALPRFDENEFDVLTGMGSLVDKSLIRQAEEVGGESRLRMLETIREFAGARLQEDTTLHDAARRAHATYFAEFASSEWVLLTGEGRETALIRLAADVENLRAAWRFWADEKNFKELRKLTDSLWLLYDARGWYHDTVKLTIELLKVLEQTDSNPERAREEMMLQTSLAHALLATKGFTPEVEKAYARALDLCQGAGETAQLFPVLRGLSTFYDLRGEYDKGILIGRQIMDLAEQRNDRDMKITGHLVLAQNLCFTETITAGINELEKGIALFDPNRQVVRRFAIGTNPGVVSIAVSSLFYWMAGFPERARRRGVESVAMARQLEHPYTLTYALFHHAILQWWLGNPEIAEENALAVLDLAEEYEFRIWSAVGSCIRGAALVEQGRLNEGLALTQQGLSAYRELKSPPVFLSLLLLFNAQAYRALAHPADAMARADEAMQLASESTSKTLAPEFLVFKGELLLELSPDNAAEAEGLFQVAIAAAREVEGTMLELRAAKRLSRLWQRQGKIEQARNLLRAPYERITEGFDTRDMKEARALLEELAKPQN